MKRITPVPLVQIVGGIFGALMVSGLMPKTYPGMGDGAPGKCAVSTRKLCRRQLDARPCMPVALGSSVTFRMHALLGLPVRYLA